MRSFANRRLLALAFVSNLVLCGTILGTDVQAQSPAAAPQSDAKAREAWRAEMLRLPLPKNGCFTTSYPRAEWREVKCGPPPPYRYVVGGGTDYVAQTSGNYISSATGSFLSSSSVAGESGKVACTPSDASCPPYTANDVFTIQMNSQSPVNSSDGSPFVTPACAGGDMSGPTPCSGWQQFVLSQTGGPAPGPGQKSVAPGAPNANTPVLFAEYWMYNYGFGCPALPPWAPTQGNPPTHNWQQVGENCVFNGPAAPVQPPMTAADLPGLVMTATAGANDAVKLVWTGGGAAYSEPSALGLSNAWTEAEFNVVGDCCKSEANFTSPTTLVVNIQLADGFPTAPTCIANDGTTGETNSLTLSGTPTVITALSQPSIEFTETNSSPAAASCSHSIGDTHLETLDGLFYDFQAAGDFVLTQADPDFVVQTRQVSGAPSWPQADLNHGVATQMGKSRVAICVLPTRLFVDGKLTDLRDGKLLSLPGGVKVYRGGNTYAVMREGGDIVNAQINSNAHNTWINVTVGVGGSARRNARGLLANPNGSVGELAARTGTVFAAPMSFADLYHPYADSWRVSSKNTLLSPCGDRDIETGAASKPFFANDLEPELGERARAICTAAHVKEGPQLDACTLDTAVLGGAEAAKVFVRTLPIRAVLRPGLPLERIEIKPIKRP
jgi:hypothetical protein